MEKYDPGQFPDATEWLALDEDDRIALVQEYHEHSGEADDLPAPRVHAAFHVLVENQVAFGAEIPVADALKRLMNEGLDRHDAIHAIGSVVAEHMHGMVEDGADDDSNAAYLTSLEQLTADGWRNSE